MEFPLNSMAVYCPIANIDINDVFMDLWVCRHFMIGMATPYI